ncbi:hypothetical protein DL93DRAFT_2059047 [Clavulina sp. PMI_390]|nr:hypothetical protein DL93DRAFT_2059047 [Clavulina sp. PMI_390]
MRPNPAPKLHLKHALPLRGAQSFISRRHLPQHLTLLRNFHNSARFLQENEVEKTRKDTPSVPPKSAPSDHSSTHAEGLSRPPPAERDADTSSSSTQPQSPIQPRDLQNYSRFFRQLAQSIPHVHRPTRDDLLKLTSSFWHRLGIRFKWLTIRSFRKFNTDDMSAFFSFALLGQTLWILIGTTTFVSFVIWMMNSLRLQSFVARSLSDYLTHETGISFHFESAIVPRWQGGGIVFENVYISRRPREIHPLPSQSALGRRAVARFEVGHGDNSFQTDHEDEDDSRTKHRENGEEEDTNYSMFDLNVDHIEVTLSLARWLDGKGIIQNLTVRGVRGVLDRRNVRYDPDHPAIPSDYRHKPAPGDFDIESVKLEDLLITVYQPREFRPYTVSIFRADLNRLRKQWVCMDFLQAENIVGQIDNCLFSLHRPQGIGRTVETDMKDAPWARMSRFRIDGMNIDHLQTATGTDAGPISWITSGKVDAVLDFKFPPSTGPKEDFDLNEIVAQIAKNISSVTHEDRLPGQRVLAKPPLRAPPETTGGEGVDRQEEIEREAIESTFNVLVDIDLRFRDVKADVPLFASELSNVNNALIRPIVAFINANRTLIPIHCRVSQDVSDFDGSWTLWETGLLDSIAGKTYDALAYHVMQANMNRRIKTVTLWSLQQTAKATLRTFRLLVEPLAFPISANNSLMPPSLMTL